MQAFDTKASSYFYDRADRRRIHANHVEKIERIMARLDEAADAVDMNLPGYRLHQLKGDLAGFWSVTVSGNWRIIFRIDGGRVYDVDLVDYH